MEERHEDLVRSAATSFAQDLPIQPPFGEALASIASSHKRFCVRPKPSKERNVSQSAVISPHVQLILQDAVSEQLAENRENFYTIMSAHPHCGLVTRAAVPQMDRTGRPFAGPWFSGFSGV